MVILAVNYINSNRDTLYMLTFNVMVNGSAVHKVRAKSKRLATAKIDRWIGKAGTSVTYTLQADRLSSASQSIMIKRNARNGECVTITV